MWQRLACMHCHICVETAGVRNKFVKLSQRQQPHQPGGRPAFFPRFNKITVKKEKNQSHKETHSEWHFRCAEKADVAHSKTREVS